ncbi:ComF family protein [Trinickia fusca]|uniref:ComF family protein n=1 Tax=Trinickia fusca TaxID=2419777 RepID=A0A494XER2_9BURK|nr:ComF family protein [Trinickia fusca]
MTHARRPFAPVVRERIGLLANARVGRARAVQLVARLTALALPRQCALCGMSCVNMSQWPICHACDSTYWNEPRLRCTSCALPLSASRSRGRGVTRYRCGVCASTPPSFDRVLALADYRAPLERLALGLKFHARLAVAREFGQRLARLALDHLEHTDWPDVVAPVPLAGKRLAERGFNQAWEIAKPLARALAIPADVMLMRRTTETAPQSRLDREARQHNVAAAFQVTRRVRGMHVALVDDVMTSGATLQAAAHALKTAGARAVTVFVALRTPKD